MPRRQIGTGQVEPGSPIVDETAGTRYEPWTDGRAVGFKVTHANGQVEYIYLNPSSGGTDPAEHEPNVFLYIGPDGDPASDDAQHYYDLGGWDAKTPQRPPGDGHG